MKKALTLEELEKRQAKIDAREPEEPTPEDLAAFAEAAPGTYEAILMDIQMPHLDGYGATDQIRHLDRPDARTIPIIALSANAYEEDIKKSLALGMTAHLAKPINSAQLIGTLEKYAGRG